MLRPAALALLTFATALSAQAPAPPPVLPAVPGPSFEDVINLQAVGGPRISPDGRTVAYTLRTTDWKENRYDTEIWLARENAAPFQLTRTEKGSSIAPRWSPDGRRIAFLADRGDKQQIYVIDLSGGEARRLTTVKDGVNAFEWAPDGAHIAFTASDPEDSAATRRKERYGEFAVEDADFRMTHLWLVAVTLDSTPKPTRLTQGGAFTVNGFQWSPDGSRIAFVHQRDPQLSSDATSDISIVTVATHEIRPLVATPGRDEAPRWSPDSKWIVYASAGGDTTADYYRNGEIRKIPADGGTPVRLSVDLDEDVSVIAWTSTGLFVAAWRGLKNQVYTLDPTAGRTRLVAGTPDYIWSMDFSADGRTVALAGQSATGLTEVYRTPLAPFRPVPVTTMTRQVADWKLGTTEVVAWNSRDGTRIEGVLQKPSDFDPARKYPLLVVIHGGPTGIDYPEPYVFGVYPVPEWLAKGALVLRPNYRGSAGYGEKFRSLNVRNLGVGDAWDVLSGVDYVVRLGIVDTTRMAAMGWSQGGYISAFLTTTTTRFRAISVGAGISDWMTYYVNTDIHPFTRQYLKATPWDDPQIYATTSPITYIKQARTPTLIQHGEFDRRVPIPNAYELYQGLHDVGVETRLIVYKGFGHGINKPKERLAATWHNWQWFAKHLWGEDVQPPLAVAAGSPNP